MEKTFEIISLNMSGLHMAWRVLRIYFDYKMGGIVRNLLLCVWSDSVI